jgi:hypothetical protein
MTTAPSLEAGAAYVERVLGVSPQAGGEHVRMGTHNRLLRLGDTLYLEVIAVNPAAPSPGRSRWFGLDALRPDSPPMLAAWVVRTPDIHTTAAASSESLGPVEAMSRGALDWLITIPADGVVPLDGVGPALIQWHADVHPASRMADCGLSLAGFEIRHGDPARVSRLLASLGLADAVEVRPLSAGEAPHLVAHIRTPQGMRQLPAVLG